MDFKGLIETVVINGVIDPLIVLAFAVALVVFLYGVVKYISQGDNEEARKKARDFILFGIVGLFVMLSVWGLVAILSNTVFPDGGGNDSPFNGDGNPYDDNVGDGPVQA